MNTPDALRNGVRSLVLIAMAALSAACGASPEGASSTDNEVLAAPSGVDPSPDGSDSDAGAVSTDTPTLPTLGPVAPVENVENGGAPAPRSGGVVPMPAPGFAHAQ